MGLTALRDPDARSMLGDLKKQFAQFEKNVSPILRELQKLVSARQASAQLVSSSEQLQGAVGRLQDSLQGEKPVATLLGVAVLAALLVVVLLLMALVFLADTRRRAAEAEAENKRNQEAILRLLNEMGDLADGDLTIRAQVTEDITGAIADSMNYTIDELRTLVSGVNERGRAGDAEDGARAVDLGRAPRRRGAAVEGDRGDDRPGVAGVALDFGSVLHRRGKRARRAALARGRRQGQARRCRTRSPA